MDNKPPGRSMCADGSFSTFATGPGRCSYHGGVLMGEMAEGKRRQAKKTEVEHTAPPKQQQPSFTPEPTCQPGVMGNYGGKQTFDYILTEIRKAGASVRYQTKKSGNQTIYWAIETPDKYQNGEALRIDVFNGAKEGAIRITTDKKALRFTCTQARQAVVTFLEAYQELQNSTESIAGKAQAIHKKIAAQIGANGLIVKPWTGTETISISHQDQGTLYRIGQGLLSCMDNPGEWEKNFLIYGPSIDLRRGISEILQCNFQIPPPPFPAGHPLEGVENDIKYRDAYDAYRASSFSPERRANSDIAGYIAQLVETYKQLSAGRTPEQMEALNRWFRTFRQKYKEKHNAWNAARSRTMSSFVVGPAKFPTASNQKKLATADRRFQELMDFEKKALDRVKRDPDIYPENIVRQPIKHGESDALQKLRRKLEQAEKAHEIMKRANKIIRERSKYSNEEFFTNLKEILPLELVKKIMHPAYQGDTPFPGWQLQNSNQRIKALKDRIAQEERTETRREEAGAREAAFEGGRIEEDISDNRIRIYFDDIPPADLRTKLKRSGWRWSRANTAWQRQATDNAWRSAKDIVGISGINRKAYVI